MLQLGLTRLVGSIHMVNPALVQAFCIATCVAALAWIEAAAVRQRRLRVVDDVALVAELNHHVRNALQAIQYATHMPVGADQIHIIEDGVQRDRSDLADFVSSCRWRTQPVEAVFWGWLIRSAARFSVSFGAAVMEDLSEFKMSARTIA